MYKGSVPSNSLEDASGEEAPEVDDVDDPDSQPASTSWMHVTTGSTDLQIIK